MRAMFLLLGVLGLGQARAVALTIEPSSLLTQSAPAVFPTSPSAVQSSASPTPEHYTLTPERRAKAIAYSRARYALYFAGVGLSLAIYAFLWLVKLTVIFRNWARRASPRLFLQCLVFVPLFVATVSLLDLPVEYYSGYVLEHRFGLSTQNLASWSADWGKGFALNIFLAIFLVWGLYWIIRRRPNRWWFYSWLASIPIALSLILIEPLVVAPLFFKFTQLDQNQPVLSSRIETMLGRAGLQIPASRIFEMDASTKTRAINAYVTGIGASKRVVVYDNATRRLDGDETLLVLGHETGHYVLGHILNGFVLFEAGALAALFLGSIAFRRMVRRLGSRTGIAGEGDLASLPIMLLIITVLGFFASPISCGFSRYFEHQADQFGLEVTYGVVADPNVAAARSFQILGEEDLEDPEPSPFIKFWLYTHPPLEERIRFAANYKPWAEGKPLEFVRSK